LTEGVDDQNDSGSLENHLLNLQIRKKMIIKSLNDSEMFDFHQRKGKEIRRLQYGCQVKDASEERCGKPRTPDLNREIMTPAVRITPILKMQGMPLEAVSLRGPMVRNWVAGSMRPPAT
jgi:hypothetical protein